MAKELKFEGGVPSGKLKAPPKSCIPRRAKMRMKRKRRKSNEMMERIELSSEMTKLRRDDQYLERTNKSVDSHAAEEASELNHNCNQGFQLYWE